PHLSRYRYTVLLLLSTTHRPSTSPLFPYTTLFRSQPSQDHKGQAHRCAKNGNEHQRPSNGEVERPRRSAGLAPRAHNLFPRSGGDRKSTRLNSSHLGISYAVFCLKKKKKKKKKKHY